MVSEEKIFKEKLTMQTKSDDMKTDKARQQVMAIGHMAFIKGTPGYHCSFFAQILFKEWIPTP